MSREDFTTVIPRFDSMAKRLALFQYQDETDKAFALRIGVSISTLKRWKYWGGEPGSTEIAKRVAEALNVSALWVLWGWEATEEQLPNGSHVLITIPKGYYQWIEPVASHENGNALMQ